MAVPTITGNWYLHIKAEDVRGNKGTNTSEVFKVDTTSPTVTLTPNTTKWTNKNVTINVNAKDEHSGVKKITYIGENMVRNGEFKEGLKYWTEDKPVPGEIGAGDISLRNGYLYLGDNRVKSNKAMQEKAFINAPEGSQFYALIEGRGKGKINARYGMYSDGGQQTNYMQDLTSETKFEEYKFGITRGEKAKNDFIVERRSQEGWIEIKKVELFAQKELTDGKLEVTENGTYNFVVEDKAGNIITKSITVTNIDKEPPEVIITPSTKELTHENVILNVGAKDDGSGVKRIVYLGESMIENGDFKNGKERWTSSAGNFEVKDGVMSLKDNTVNANKVYQQKAFIGSEIGASYYAEMDARGSGVLNARYAVKTDGTGKPQQEHKVPVTNNFERYRFFMERRETSTDSFMIERIGKGEIEVKDVEVYAEKDITDFKKLEVRQNGSYTFVVEDNAGNITTKTHEVTNIDKYTKLHKPTISPFSNSSISNEAQSIYANVGIKIEDWRDSPGWKLNAKATELTNGNYVLPMKLNGKNLSNSIRIAESIGVRGVHEENMDDLEIQIPPTAKAGEYESKITWELIIAP